MARIRSGFLLARGAAWGLQDTGDHREKGSDTAGMGSVEMSAKCHAWVKGEEFPNTLACTLPHNASLHCKALQRAVFPCVEEKNNPQSKISLGKAHNSPALPI